VVYGDADGEVKERGGSGTIGTRRRRNGLAVRCAALLLLVLLLSCREGEKQSSSSTSPVHNMQSYYRRYLTDTGEAAIWSSLSLAERKTASLLPGLGDCLLVADSCSCVTFHVPVLRGQSEPHPRRASLSFSPHDPQIRPHCDNHNPYLPNPPRPRQRRPANRESCWPFAILRRFRYLWPCHTPSSGSLAHPACGNMTDDHVPSRVYIYLL